MFHKFTEIWECSQKSKVEEHMKLLNYLSHLDAVEWTETMYLSHHMYIPSGYQV
jgi:hypothetical protein